MDDSFHLFPRLPPEIRALIWKTSLWTPSIVQLCFHLEDPEDPEEYEVSLKNRVIPPLLHVCSESRLYAREVYPGVCADQKDSSTNTYMNLEIDTLYIGTANRDVEFIFISDVPFRDLRQGSRTCDVRHFACEIDYWRRESTQLCLIALSIFSGLKSITLVIEDDDPSSSPAKLVDLNADELRQETGGLGHADGIQDPPVKYRDVAENIRMAHQKMVDYERDEDPYLGTFEGWSLPEVRVKKLVGNIFAQRTKEPKAGS